MTRWSVLRLVTTAFVLTFSDHFFSLLQSAFRRARLGLVCSSAPPHRETQRARGTVPIAFIFASIFPVAHLPSLRQSPPLSIIFGSVQITLAAWVRCPSSSSSPVRSRSSLEKDGERCASQ
ncbi:hypothetical protein FB45DRAFT_1035316 [Roridomyces roridus]|uniref:Uncharacterized protein n=1 Tax=Roridomyces roridus TaxID=1738132 RepID=A0AAD7BAU7_9AGAR|nr:hypothetical protein FB45DRAFT_1035316 [Roridomyces roridus]